MYYLSMRHENHTITLPEGAPQMKIIDTVNNDTSARIFGLIDAEGYDGQVTVQFTSRASLETIRSIITHCCQNSQERKWWNA